MRLSVATRVESHCVACRTIKVKPELNLITAFMFVNEAVRRAWA